MGCSRGNNIWAEAALGHENQSLFAKAREKIRLLTLTVSLTYILNWSMEERKSVEDIKANLCDISLVHVHSYFHLCLL